MPSNSHRPGRGAIKVSTHPQANNVCLKWPWTAGMCKFMGWSARTLVEIVCCVLIDHHVFSSIGQGLVKLRDLFHESH